MIRRSRALSVRILGMVAAFGLLIAFAPGEAQAAQVSTACRSVGLAVPAGTTESAVYGGDAAGRYLVGVGFHSGGSDGLLWVDGQPVSINQGSLSPYIQVQFNAVNSRREIIGERMTDETSFHTDAFVYRNGRFTLLAAPSPGESTEALAINSRGDVVGDAQGSAGWQPVEWSAARPGTVRVLATPGTGGGFASSIDEDGTVVGHLTSSSPGVPYVWPAKGTAYALPIPAGSLGGEAVAIRHGLVAGNVFDPATGSTAVAEWNLRTGSFTMWPSVQGAALSINRWGTIGVAGGDLVHADGRIVAVTGWVYAVTDRGSAAGTTNDFTGHAVLWLDC